MARWLNGSRRLARRVLPLTMGGVVAIFVASTVYTELLLTDDSDALDIAVNSAPSVAFLADARGELRRLANEGARVISDGTPSAVADARAAFEARRQAIEAALASYVQTPDYPGEHELYGVVRAKLARVDEALHHGADAPAAERAAAAQTFALTVDDLDSAMHALSEINRAHLMTASAAIAEKGRRRNRWAFLLDGLGIIAAFGATVLAARTVERYLATLSRRARELEHMAIEVGHEIATPLMPIELALGSDGGAAGEPNHSGMARARRAVQRIRASLERLTTFAAAGRPPEPPLPRTALEPALVTLAREAGLDAVVEPDTFVRCSELSLQALLRDLFSGSATPGGTLERLDVGRLGAHVRISVARSPAGDRGVDPFDPQLHMPDSDHPGIDLRLATVRRRVEACGGRVGVRRERGRDRLWIELPLA